MNSIHPVEAYFNALSPERKKELCFVKHIENASSLFHLYFTTADEPYRSRLENKMKDLGFGDLVDLFRQTEASVKTSLAVFDDMMVRLKAHEIDFDDPVVSETIRSFVNDSLVKLPHLTQFVNSLELFGIAFSLIEDSCIQRFGSNLESYISNEDAKPPFVKFFHHNSLFRSLFDLFSEELDRHRILMSNLINNTEHKRVFLVPSGPAVEDKLRRDFGSEAEICEMIMVKPYALHDTKVADTIYKALYSSDDEN